MPEELLAGSPSGCDAGWAHALLRLLRGFAATPLCPEGRMIHIESGLYVRVQELDNGPLPRPLQSGFSEQRAYRVLGIYSASESSECFLILSNDRSELWFVSNRHFRVVGLRRSLTDTVVPLHEAIAAHHPQPIPEAAPETSGPGRQQPPSSLHFNHGSSSYA